MERWNKDEEAECLKYFGSTMGEMALFMRLQRLKTRRTYEAMTRHLRYMRAAGFEKGKEVALKTLRVGYLDIEATNLDADFGMMLSWYIKTAGKNEYFSGIIKTEEIRNYTFDKRIVEELLEAFNHYDVVWAHYGSDRRFDIPFIRTRAFRWKLEEKLPKNMELFIMDTYPIARNKLKLHSNRLASIAELLDVKVKKTPLSPRQWELAKAGNKEALDYVALHNKRDVQVLEGVHKRLKVIDNKPIYRSI